MCGIAGFIGKEKEKEKILKNMTDRIAHRGPDDEGFFIDGDVALGHRRLSIIDIKGGKQPMKSNDEDVIIVFNGEIYNFKELKNELTDYDFKTNSDTEVIIAGYKKWGKDLPKYLRGMFAFAIYDKKEKELFCARDHFGIKPFYYYINEEKNTFMFASEIKAFLDHPSFKKEFNDSILPNYLNFSFTPTKETFFKGVYRLDAGNYLVFKNNKIEVNEYFHIDFNEKNDTYEEAVKNIKDVMINSVNHHMISDVEVGSFLSSGIDSSYIVTLAKPNKTYTAGYENKKYDETSYVKELTKELNIENKVREINKDEYINSIDKIMYHMDEPSCDPAIVSLYFVSNLASKDVKVVLSGEGADEFFAGYNTYHELTTHKLYFKLPFFIKHAMANIAKLMPDIKGKYFFIRHGEKVENRYVGVNPVWYTNELKTILVNEPTIKNSDITKPYLENHLNKSELQKMQIIDIKFWLMKDILHKADRMTMANSIEGRTPFTDIEVFNVANTLKQEYKINKNGTKMALREAAKDVIPTQAWNKKKLGFPVPLRDWMREDDVYNLVLDELNSDIAKKYFKTDVLINMLEDHKNNKKDNYRKIWSIYCFLRWYNVFFE